MILAFTLLAVFQAIAGWNAGGNLLGLFQQTVPKPWLSFGLLAVGIAVGPFVLGTGVAHTIGRNIIVLTSNDIYVLNEALVATLITLMLSWVIGMPTSTSLVLASIIVWTTGCMIGGKRIAKTVGEAFYRLKPKHVVSIQAAAAVVVVSAAAFGGPVSSTQTIDSALIGVGNALRHQRVNHVTAAKLFAAWGLTLPIAVMVGAITAWISMILSGWHF